MPLRKHRASHIERRHNTYYATLDVPKAVRSVIGKKRFVKSLKTESIAEAERRAPKLVASWKIQIEKARKHLDPSLTDSVEADAMYWREILRNAESPEEQAAMRELIADFATDIDQGTMLMLPHTGAPVGSSDAETFFNFATGKIIRTDEYLDDWLATLGELTPKTRDMRATTVKRLAKRLPTLDEISGKTVYQWTLDLMGGRSAPAFTTVQKMLSECRLYWRHLQAMEIVPAELAPFDAKALGFGKSNHKSKSGPPKRLPFTTEEVVQLHQAAIARADQQLADLIELAMWTGCRIGELCSLPLSMVEPNNRKGGTIEIQDAKTSAGWRTVPVHPQLSGTLRRLLKESTDDYVLSGLSDANKYEDRSSAVGKRFGRLRRDAGFGKQHVFHSIRKTVVTILENEGVAEGVVADIVGHEKQTITYGLYSGGSSLETKRKAILKLWYPAV